MKYRLLHDMTDDVWYVQRKAFLFWKTLIGGMAPWRFYWESEKRSYSGFDSRTKAIECWEIYMLKKQKRLKKKEWSIEDLHT